MFPLFRAVILRNGFLEVADGIGGDKQVAGGVDDVRVAQLLLVDMILPAGFIEICCDNADLIGDD